MQIQPEFWGAADESDLIEVLTAAHDDVTVKILHVITKQDKGYLIMFERTERHEDGE